MSGLDDAHSETASRAQARLETLELELERAHRLLDEYGVPREFRIPGERDPVEYSLVGRLELVFDDDE